MEKAKLKFITDNSIAGFLTANEVNTSAEYYATLRKTWQMSGLSGFDIKTNKKRHRPLCLSKKIVSNYHLNNISFKTSPAILVFYEDVSPLGSGDLNSYEIEITLEIIVDG